MGLGCSHHFQYAQGHFRCSKCGKRGKERQYKRNHNKSYATIVIIGIAVIVGIYVYANYDIKVDEQKFEQMLPLKMVEQKFDELYETIPTESIQSTLQNFADSIPIKIDERTLTLEDRLVDCSKYKREYLESYQNVKTTEDSMAAMIGDSLAGVQKTRACEEYNKQIRLQYAPAPYAVSPEVDENIDDVKQEEYAQAREDFARMMEIRCQDITQKDLSGCDLRGFTLHDKDLSYVNLQGANLYHVDLSRTNFTGANLDGAYIAGTILTDTIFTGCTGIPTGIPEYGTQQICTPIP